MTSGKGELKDNSERIPLKIRRGYSGNEVKKPKDDHVGIV